MARKRRVKDLNTALFRVTRDKVGLAVHRDAQGHILEQREIPYITQQQLEGKDLLASIVSHALSATILFLGYQFGKEIAEKVTEQVKHPTFPTVAPQMTTRDGWLAELESRKAAARMFRVPIEHWTMREMQFDEGRSVNREWLLRHLPAEISPHEMEETEIVKIPRYYL